MICPCYYLCNTGLTTTEVESFSCSASNIGLFPVFPNKKKQSMQCDLNNSINWHGDTGHKEVKLQQVQQLQRYLTLSLSDTTMSVQ